MTLDIQAQPFTYCPHCASPLRPRVLVEGDHARLACIACDFVHYRNPRLAAAAIIQREGKLILVRRAIEPQRGLWVFPGGFVDSGETVQAAAVRETFEETGLRIGLTGILDVYSSIERDVALVVYAAESRGGMASPGSECDDLALYAPENLPWEELAFDATRDALRDYLRRFFPRVRPR